MDLVLDYTYTIKPDRIFVSSGRSVTLLVFDVESGLKCRSSLLRLANMFTIASDQDIIITSQTSPSLLSKELLDKYRCRTIDSVDCRNLSYFRQLDRYTSPKIVCLLLSYALLLMIRSGPCRID